MLEKLYCNTVYCIARGGRLGCRKIVLQYNILYCNQMGHEAAGLCHDTGPRHGQPGHDTAQGRAVGACRRAGGCWAERARALGTGALSHGRAAQRGTGARGRH